ncbi:hypothetical protein [Tenggerimyces flavus]|uniref:Glycoside hydrolase family 42 N-terminal domain-containing protein n=1 Tax=Tenggerimyces flavus TaxID=1708749 RepID=A0ABV7YJN5_9ACTN|nr:hypothetical protein [Tenggerimyces flavus]MBM7783978.1 hypothetical protein [Tenggerimyces flavus]
MTNPTRKSGALSRRTLLGIAAGAAGASLLPASAFASTARVGAVVPLAGSPTLLTDAEFPIGFFWPPPRRQSTQARYDEIADAGFTLVLGGNDVVQKNASQKILPFAQAAGLRVLPVDDRINQCVPKPGFENDLRAVLEEYSAFPAFAGFRIDDEPVPTEYPRYRMITDVLAAAAPDKLSHFNLVPAYDPAADLRYREFISRYVEQVDPTFVSFDHYPLLKDGTTRPTFFANHQRIREAGLAAGLPTWVYIQSVDHGIMKRPTFAELAWQINMGLAYGCKGIQYFTYWTPGDADFVFGEALIKKDGCQSQVYVDARTINRTYLQPVGRQLKHLKSEKVFHALESPLPLGAVGFASAQSTVLNAVAGTTPVVMGELSQLGGDARRWVLVANRSFKANASVTLTVKPGVAAVSLFDPATSAYGPVPLNGGAFSVSLAPGMAKLYLLAPA